jgi:hypothetical protein
LAAKGFAVKRKAGMALTVWTVNSGAAHFLGHPLAIASIREAPGHPSVVEVHFISTLSTRPAVLDSSTVSISADTLALMAEANCLPDLSEVARQEADSLLLAFLGQLPAQQAEFALHSGAAAFDSRPNDLKTQLSTRAVRTDVVYALEAIARRTNDGELRSILVDMIKVGRLRR